MARSRKMHACVNILPGNLLLTAKSLGRSLRMLLSIHAAKRSLWSMLLVKGDVLMDNASRQLSKLWKKSGRCLSLRLIRAILKPLMFYVGFTRGKVILSETYLQKFKERLFKIMNV